MSHAAAAEQVDNARLRGRAPLSIEDAGIQSLCRSALLGLADQRGAGSWLGWRDFVGGAGAGFTAR